MTVALRIPTIGIGAGPHCDGQVLVAHDLLGLTRGRTPPSSNATPTSAIKRRRPVGLRSRGGRGPVPRAGTLVPWQGRRAGGRRRLSG